MTVNNLYAKIAVDLPDDPKIIRAGSAAELVYIRCILRSRACLSDGLICRELVPRWFAGCPQPVRSLQRLVDNGLLLEHPDGWQIPPDVWRKWAPTAAEVQAKRDADAERKRKRREEMRAASDERPRGQHAESGPRPRTTETETETQSKTKAESETTTTTGNSQLGVPAGVVVVGGIPLPANAEHALRLYAEHTAMSSRERPKNPKRYMQGVIRHATADYGADLLAYVGNNPDATPAQIARDVLYLTEVDLYRLGVA